MAGRSCYISVRISFVSIGQNDTVVYTIYFVRSVEQYFNKIQLGSQLATLTNTCSLRYFQKHTSTSSPIDVPKVLAELCQGDQMPNDIFHHAHPGRLRRNYLFTLRILSPSAMNSSSMRIITDLWTKRPLMGGFGADVNAKTWKTGGIVSV